MNSLGGKIDGNAVTEYQMGDKAYVSVKAGKGGLFMTAKASGMEIGINAVPEARENGIAAKATVTLNGMEVVTAEIEKLNEGEITGAFDTANKIELTIKDLKEKKNELVTLFRQDVAVNYKPVLKDKLQKAAPEMLSIFSSLKRLVKQNAPAVMNKVPALK